MVQGTASNAGKSLLAAGLCRIFAQDGLRVAPFKSQNMALNSFITREGLEMGRAQVMQAEAAGVEPSAAMNPILLKPTTETGSQVIVNGEVVGNLSAAEYFRYKKRLVPVVRAAYARLAAQNDVVVIEGAGSPAEINLKQDDIVNMGMAALAGAPVLLVGDIDRGGVFASLYGTVSLLAPEERARVKGLLINKFRGDVSLLKPGLSQLESLTGIPVLGVVPWMDVDLDDEDSLAPRLSHRSAGAVDAAVVRLPHLANFTDFSALARVGIGVRYAASPEALGTPDLAVLPGTKNTMGDLRWLRQTGMETALQKLAKSGVPLLGICGGYQMLGQSLADPDGAEGGGALPGMGLLPADTVFSPQKTRTRAAGVVEPLPAPWAGLSGCTFTGYEIHMGRTRLREGARPFAMLDGKPDGAVCGNVLGSYAHGLFDSGTLAAALAALLHPARRGQAPAPLPWAAYKEQQYDKLAAMLRASLDMGAIYRMLGLGGR